MVNTKILKISTKEHVYDISLDGTFVDAFTGFVCHNTDGFNFQLPSEDKYRYTKEKPYIGKGSNREVKLDKEYYGYEADVAEFNDLYMNKVYSPVGVQKMGLGIDEIVSSTINFSRKNYADYFPDKPFPKDVKMVGNTIKSKKMPEYIAKFLSKGIRLLLQGKGQEFLNEYYLYIDKIYNYNIPIRDIASKGKIKKSIEEYINDVKQVTKAGRPKSRQAWYELAIKSGIKVDNGDTIYYINTGKSKSHSDIKKVTTYFIYENGDKKDITKDIDKKKKEVSTETGKKLTTVETLNKYFPGWFSNEEIIFNCVMLPNEIVDSEEDTYCTDGLEYNTAKYIDMFNKRITPLLVCFSKSIRDKILVTNPDDKQFFTEEECKLVSGEPNKASDQDTYEQLMTMEDKELSFWIENDMIPPFVEECCMGEWEQIKNDYLNKLEEEKKNGIKAEKDLFYVIIENMNKEDYENLIEEGELPASLYDIVEIDPLTGNLMSKKYKDVMIAPISELFDFYANNSYIKTVED